MPLTVSHMAQRRIWTLLSEKVQTCSGSGDTCDSVGHCTMGMAGMTEKIFRHHSVPVLRLVAHPGDKAFEEWFPPWA